jgi:hypothetical protein
MMESVEEITEYRTLVFGHTLCETIDRIAHGNLKGEIVFD